MWTGWSSCSFVIFCKQMGTGVGWNYITFKSCLIRRGRKRFVGRKLPERFGKRSNGKQKNLPAREETLFS